MMDGATAPVSSRHRRNAVHAPSAGPSNMIVFQVASGPRASVTGAMTRLGPGIAVVHARL